MGNSTVRLRDVVDLAMTLPDIMPVFAVPGSAQQPALSIANRVFKDMFAPTFPWKFNRVIVPPFQTISWQQDYATIQVKNVGWLEHAFLRDINNTAFPKPIVPLRVVRDLERTSYQFGNPDEICWLPNDQLTYATWGGGSQGDPGPGSVYTNPLGANITPANPYTQIIDPNGNLWIIKTYGTTGSVQPTWPASGQAVGVNQADGSVLWTIVDPKAIGLRVNPLPPQTGRVWEVNVIAQNKIPKFTAMTQLLDPLPDDFASYFEQGFIAYAHEHSVVERVRSKSESKVAAWMGSVKQALGQGDREPDSPGIYPATNIMDGQVPIDIGPAWPYRR